MSTPTPDEQDIESTLGHLSKADLLTLIKRMVQLYPDLTGLIETAQQTTPSQRPQRFHSIQNSIGARSMRFSIRLIETPGDQKVG